MDIKVVNNTKYDIKVNKILHEPKTSNGLLRKPINRLPKNII